MSLTSPLDALIYSKRSLDKDSKFEILFKRNQYLEKEYAKLLNQLEKEKKASQVKSKEVQSMHEFKAKCESLQKKLVKLTERMNEYHLISQQANAQTIALKRKVSGILRHINSALQQETVPGAAVRERMNSYERLHEENRLLKWKLSVVEGYFSGMFASETDETGETGETGETL